MDLAQEVLFEFINSVSFWFLQEVNYFLKQYYYISRLLLHLFLSYQWYVILKSKQSKILLMITIKNINHNVLLKKNSKHKSHVFWLPFQSNIYGMAMTSPLFSHFPPIPNPLYIKNRKFDFVSRGDRDQTHWFLHDIFLKYSHTLQAEKHKNLLCYISYGCMAAQESGLLG